MIKPTTAYQANDGSFYATEKEACHRNSIISLVSLHRENFFLDQLGRGVDSEVLANWLIKYYAEIKSIIEGDQ